MIHEALMDNSVRSFGNALYEVLLDHKKLVEWEADREYMFFPHGTVITNDHMAWALNAGYQPFFIQCGWDGEVLDRDLVEQSLFLGARGEITQIELSDNDINVEVFGEPANKLPKKFERAQANALTLAVRNILDPGEYAKDTKFQLKADMLVAPVIEDKDDILEIVELVSGSRFVLSGSLSVAAVAHAYGVPFAPMKSEFEDNPVRWQDWFTSIGLDYYEIHTEDFPKDVREGREWYNENFKKEG
jgi:hypothetical protein